MHFHFFTYKCLWDQIWYSPKIGQGHPRVTIYAIYDGLTSQMLHTKFHANRPSGSVEEDFWRVFTIYMGMVAILVMWPGPYMQTFVPPSHGGSTWNMTSIGPMVPEEKTFENINTWHTDRQQPWHMISSPMSLRLRWANNQSLEN